MAEMEPSAIQASDDVLIERIQAGDEAAVDIVYERYFPRVFSFVRRRIGNRADVEETVQEVFLAVFSSLHSYRREAVFAAWVLGIARHTVASRFKKKHHPTVSLAAADDPNAVGTALPTLRREPTPLENFECEERVERLAAVARSELTPDQRKVFELHHLRHRPIQEIARTLRKTEDAVKSNLYRARMLLLAR